MNVSHKLEFFSKAAIQEALNQKDEITAEMDAEMERTLEEIRQDTEKQMAARIQSESYKIDQVKNREIIQASTEAKKSLIELRGQLMDDLFGNVANRIDAFVTGPGYLDYLTKAIEKAIRRHQGQGQRQREDQSSDQSKCQVLLTPRDMVHAPELARLLSLSLNSFQEAREDFVGGFKLYLAEKNAMEDHSFRSRLTEERSNFVLFKIADIREAQ